jgi:hypothetical protein
MPIDLDDIRADIKLRWRIPNWELRFPWWPRAATVKILMYADGPVAFDGGPFFGLKQVLATLTADPYPWVRFDVTTVHRGADPSADRQGLDLADALALDSFDELWIYSFNSGPQLTARELVAAEQFMDDHDGGVLITGDHADLGAAFGNLPRAGKMRRLPAPPAAPPSWNSTLRSGANAVYEFDDQSDATPQPLALTWYWGGLLRRRPHQLLCSPLGPIDVFPDHQHEGEAVAPPAAPATEWPGGIAAEVVARGTVIDPNATPGRSIGVLSAYDGHQVGVGRIVADSTWHHHFDINLQGLGFPGRTGFVVPGTTDWLTSAQKIEHYFVNAAVWLAPPAKQAAMRSAAWWPILWSNHLVELDTRLTPLPILGRAAWDALGRYAPQCAVFHWIWDLVPIELKKIHLPLLDRPDPPPFLEHFAGALVRELQQRVDVSAGVPDRPELPDDLLGEVVPAALTVALKEQLEVLDVQTATLKEMGGALRGRLESPRKKVRA